MLNIAARNLRRLVKADITVDRITLLAGANNQGKTSLIQGIGEAIKCDDSSHFNLPKKDAQRLVHHGARGAYVEVSTDTGSVQLELPSWQRKAVGDTPPQASAVALGMKPIAEISLKDRAAVLEPYLHATPTRDDLTKALTDGYEPETIDRMWKLIERDGWNATHATQAKRRTETTGAWKQVTGETFGSEKARSWTPKGWRRGLEETPIEELQKRIAAAETVLEKIIAAKGADAVETAQLQKLAAALPELENDLEAKRVTMEQAQIRYADAVRKRQQLPALSREAGLSCPHCGGAVVVHQDLAVTTLQKFTPIPEGKLKEARLAIADAEGAMKHDQAALAAARNAFAIAEKAVADAQQARAGLETTTTTTIMPASIDLETARSHVKIARDDLTMVQHYEQASDLFDQWEMLNEFVELLAPTGLRQKKMVDALGNFNKKLITLTERAEWPTIKIEDDLRITCGGDDLLGESHTFRANTIWQLAVALEDGSDIVLIDGAEVLVGDAREELFQILEKFPIPIVVAMSLPDIRRTPDLAKLGLGNTFWIEDGTTRPLAEAKAAA